MSTSTSVQHFAPPFASLSTSSVGLRPSWLSSSQSATSQDHHQHHHQHHQQPPQQRHHQRSLSHSTNGLDTLAEGSQYVLNQLQISQPNGTVKKDYSNDQQLSPTTGKRPADRDLSMESRVNPKKSSSAAPVRRRISRACDQCNQLRTKCDGQSPCAHCIEFGLTCEYARERKKRGKASKKDLAQQAAAAAAAAGGASGGSSAPPSNPDIPASIDKQAQPTTVHDSTGGFDTYSNSSRHPPDVKPPASHLQTPTTAALPSPGTPQHQHQQQQQIRAVLDNVQMNGFASLSDVNRSCLPMTDIRSIQGLQSAAVTSSQATPPALATQPFTNYHDSSYNLINTHDHHQANMNGFRFGNTGEAGSVPFLGLSPPAQSPGWGISLPSPPPPTSYPPFTATTIPPVTNSLRYPVLQPVLPHITSIIPQSLACDLLELYFTSSSSTHLCPQSPYVVGYCFRKQSILDPTRPRQCSPALLASMLWVAAQTSDAAFLTSPPSARGRVCQKLLELTIGLLKPLIHGPASGETSPNYAANMVINGVALGGFGVSMDQLGAESSATGAIDDVATYIHLATVVSASEYKAASIRWWTAAWSLARELKLGRELAPDASHPADRDGDTEMGRHHMPGHSGDGGMSSASHGGPVTEEEREERRRIWWLLYTMDRHLALCYNRPLSLLDKECETLLQPLRDDLWQNGDFHSPTATNYRRAGPPLECTDHSMFGYFLPLMTILGEIVELNIARNHPRFGLNFRNPSEWESHLAEISRHLEHYEQSLREFEARHTAPPGQTATSLALASLEEPSDGQLQDVVSPSGRSSSTAGSRISESIVQTKIVVAYGTHIMHVLHILLTGKWDPIALLDDDDFFISSESFVRAMGHAVGAAEAAADILEHDPDLSFMPFFFGVYLLQGSFLLLLSADRLQGDASPSVVRACETIVRAHESCVATLNTEYQRNFRKVMRSALAQVRGRVPDDFGEQQHRRREVLALYRWTGDGSGLAL